MSETAKRPRKALDGGTDALRHLAERAPIGLVATAVDGTVFFVNQAWRDLTGVSDPLPISFARITDVIHPEDRQRVIDQYVRAAHTLESFSVEMRLVRPGGDVCHVRVEGHALVEDGEVVAFTGSTTDISEIVDATQARQISEQRYRDLIDKAPVGQAVYDLDGVLVEVNEAWANLLGYEPHEVIGAKASSFVHADDDIDIREVAELLLSGAAYSIERERRLRHRDGRSVWISSTLAVERDAQGRPLHFHSMIVDITERKQAELALRASEQRYRKLIDESPVGQIVSELDGTLIEVNRALLHMLGGTEEELFARDPRALMHPDDRAAYEAEIPRLLAGEIDRIECERRLVRLDGSIVWVSGGTTLVREGDDLRLHAVMEDVTTRKDAEERVRKSEDRFRTLTESLPVGVYQSDSLGRITYVNPRWYEITGREDVPESYDDALRSIHPDDRGQILRSTERMFRSGEPYHGQYRVVMPDGAIRWLNTRGTPTHDREGNTNGVIGSIEDITALVAAQEQNARLAAIIESTADMVGITDVDSQRLVYLNQAARREFGLVDVELKSVSGFSLYATNALATYRDSIQPVIRRGDTWSGELPMINAAGREILVWQSISPTMRADGTVSHISTVGRDVTERRRFEADLAYQATHDSLTGLPNRALLLDHLELALARAERDNRLIALLFLDLDRFKLVNDLHGHDAGDELLAQTARLISGVVRPSDTVARLGGDEFVILCDDVDDEDHAVAVAHRVAAAIESSLFAAGGTNLAISASIGIAMAAGGAAHPEALLRDADAAMYRAKDLGRARLEIYDETMRRRSARRLELSEELAEGIEVGDIVVRFQPGVDMRTGEVTCVEALARWQHPERGLLPPTEFIALAEETGLIVGLGLRVLSTACEHGRRWELDLGRRAPRVHVNLSARQLTTSNLPVLVQGVLDGSGLTPSQLCLEITESVLMEDASAVIDTLWELKALGVVLAIDDFGTGYSSLSYLRRFPVDVLKVDQSFVAGLGPDPEDSTIVAAIVNLASTLELEAIAEGVETLDQVDRLLALGCDMAQGYYFAEPVEPDAITPMILTGFPPAPVHSVRRPRGDGS